MTVAIADEAYSSEREVIISGPRFQRHVAVCRSFSKFAIVLEVLAMQTLGSVAVGTNHLMRKDQQAFNDHSHHTQALESASSFSTQQAHGLGAIDNTSDATAQSAVSISGGTESDGTLRLLMVVVVIMVVGALLASILAVHHKMQNSPAGVVEREQSQFWKSAKARQCYRSRATSSADSKQSPEKDLIRLH
mmetsp:Transcript_51134/g.79928  ORF Transcript_51134/g.79928 Transcript_51134/m.79928 type:complete len:191 (+) Transcript_51134:96-668(+)